LEKKKNVARYLKITIISVIAAVVIIGGGSGVIYDKDRIGFDIQKLKSTMSIANALNLKVSFKEGFIVINRAGRSGVRKTEIPTLKNVEMKEMTIQLNFKSLFFTDSIEIKKTDALKTPFLQE